MKAVVGLGNPGVRYADTRHNVGFWVVDRVAGSATWDTHTDFLSVAVSRSNIDLALVKPTTYMNGSGSAVVQVARQFQMAPDEVLVVVDDVHLPLGRLRFRRGGSHGGHNGLRSIIDEWQTDGFPRLRLGVGYPSDSGVMIDHVLGVFDTDEAAVIQEVVQHAANGVVCWATSGIESAMNRYNSLMVEQCDGSI